MAKTCVTTAKDFELFQKEVKRWVKYWGLHGWTYSFEHTEDPPLQSLGWCKVAETCDGTPDRRTVFGLEKNWDEEVSNETLKRIAFHEACELLFAKIEALACDRFVLRREIREEVHNLIRTLENTVYKDIR